MILATLLGSCSSGPLEKSDFAVLRSRAEEALGWMMQPDKALAPIGDTDPRSEISDLAVAACVKNQAALVTDTNIRAILTGEGNRAQSLTGIKPYYDAGYVFARALPDGRDQPITTASYFAQIAGFHSRTHKHADHMSFVWHDRGCSILIDPGRFGYGDKTKPESEPFAEGFWYTDPKRIYVERTRAHNCVEVDGRDYPRKGVRPFGSALRFAAEQDGLFVTVCDARPLRHIRHVRSIILNPGRFLLVLDWLKDAKDRPHEFRQWFQLAPLWQARRFAGMIAAEHPSGFNLRVASLLDHQAPSDIVCGQTSPNLQGWMSDEALSLVPTPSFHLAREKTSVARFATLFSLSRHLEVLGATAADDFVDSRFQWRTENGEVAIQFERSQSCTAATAQITAGLRDRPATRKRLVPQHNEIAERNNQADEGNVKAVLAERTVALEARTDELEDELEAERTIKTQQVARAERFKAQADRFKAQAESFKAQAGQRKAQAEKMSRQLHSSRRRAKKLETKVSTIKEGVRFRLGSAVVDLPERLLSGVRRLAARVWK